MFFSGNGPWVYELEGALSNCKQQGNSVVEYFGKLTKMCDKLVNYRKAPVCYYGEMTCKQIADRKRQCEEKKVLKFLLGLYPSFHTNISKILNMNLLPTIDNAYNMVIREERHSVIAETRIQE